MPTYVYAVIQDDGSDGDHFELMQPITAPALKVHPETGKPVRRVPTLPNIPMTHTDAAEKTKLSNKNLDRLGFTKYEKSGDGFYEKKAGKGPDVISRD